MTEKTEEQIKDELKKAVAEIKKIQQGNRSPKWSKIIKEIVQDDDVSKENEKIAKPNTNENEATQGL